MLTHFNAIEADRMVWDTLYLVYMNIIPIVPVFSGFLKLQLFFDIFTIKQVYISLYNVRMFKKEH